MFQSPNLEFIVSQAIWLEGDTKFADIILPACTNFERVDISEWAGLGGYGHHGQQQLNHRVIIFQAPAIEPLGESKSDFWIFNEICKRLGPALRERGLIFVGIDVIDGHLTEINVTSPTGIRAIRNVGGPDIAAMIWDAIEKKRKATAKG